MLKLIALLYLTCAGLTVAGPVPQCPDAQDQSLPLPSSVAPGQLVSFEKNVLAFLQSRTYVSLGWCSDKAIRNTGPYQNGVSYGPHPAVRIYYSPKVMKWLLGGRIGAIPDGGMIIKEQLPPPAERYSSSAPDPSDWTVMIRDSAGSKDGWFWGEWYDGMPFDDDAFPFNYPAAGFGLYCLRCHSSAAKEYTFASLDNIKGFPGSPLKYAVDNSWQAAGPGSSLHGSPPANPGVTLPGPPNPAFLQTFPGFPAPTYEGVQRMPSETYDRVVSGAHGPEQFLTSEQCMNCHSALNGPFGPTMFLQTGPFSTGSYPGYNVSPYGEWRWSPMGLAGRDPVFHSQVESELAFAKTRMSNPGTQIVNLCFSCHGVMGKRQIDIDHRADPDFKLDYVQLTDRADPHFKYGSLARDGISCATCHHIVESQYPPYEPPLKYFLEHSITGQFETGSSEQVFGPFKDQSISTWPMKNALGITPKHNAYVKSARLCGSCHTIRLPVLDSPNPDTFSIEQATYLEWLNSAYQNEFKPVSSASKTCQDCHMPGGIHNKDFDIDQLKERIAIIEDNTYPPVLGRVPDVEIRVRERGKGFVRHTFQGLNAFLLEFFNQFADILGVRTSDYMSVSDTGIPNALNNFVQQAQSQTARVEVSVYSSGSTINADVTVTNLTGHRLPSGVGFRRAFIELMVLDPQQRPVWSSGRTNDLGVIVDGRGEPLPSEFFASSSARSGTIRQAFQPHREVIDAEDQVQIYEELTTDSEGKFTTNFVRRDQVVKDNRLLPLGWSALGPDPSLSGEFLEATFPKGEARLDPEYQDGSGTDRTTYRITLPSQVDPKTCSVRTTLYYQAIPPYYLAMRFKAAPDGPATGRLYFFGSHLQVANSEISNWKLKLASAEHPVR